MTATPDSDDDSKEVSEYSERVGHIRVIPNEPHSWSATMTGSVIGTEWDGKNWFVQAELEATWGDVELSMSAEQARGLAEGLLTAARECKEQ